MKPQDSKPEPFPVGSRVSFQGNRRGVVTGRDVCGVKVDFVIHQKGAPPLLISGSYSDSDLAVTPEEESPPKR